MNGERRFSGRPIPAALIALVLILAFATAVTATGPVLSVAPANPRFVAYLNDLAAGRVQQTTEDGYALGLAPVPVDLPHVKPKAMLLERALVGLPTSYDLRTQDKLTAVKDQGSCGDCWAFATYGSMESVLKPSETWSFSENNMKNYAGFDLSCCAGGNQFMSTAYLARWTGPVTTSDDPHNPVTCTSTTAPAAQKHVQDVDFIADRTGPLDNDAIKRAVMAYGAMYTCFYVSTNYYNPSTCAYYYSGSYSVNHAVCIVGWDDNFDRSQFLTPPPGNGAFLIKNSWGAGWGMAGYFWISYYDRLIGTENAMFRVTEPTVNYNHNYQYDPLGWTESAGYGVDTGWLANVFTSGGKEQLNAVSIYTAVPDSTYELRIYVDPTSGPINPEGPVATQTGTISSAGYQTVQLNSSIPLDQGLRFSAVLRLTTPGYDYPIPLEAPSLGYSSTATANTGETYLSPDGVEWTDATSTNPNSNACLKAFTADRVELVVTPASGLTATGPVGGPFSQTNQVYTLRNAGTTPLNWSAAKNQPWIDLSAESGSLDPGQTTDVTVSLNSGALGLGAGSHTDTVLFTNETDGLGSTSRTISLGIRDGTLSVTPPDGFSTSGEPHGPFAPDSQTYTLKNVGYADISWSASKTQSWLDLSGVSGSLSPGASVDVTVSVNANAATLGTGSYSDTVTFTNTTNDDGDATRPISLNIFRNYEMSATTFQWMDPTNHASFVLSDDGVTGPQNLPFAFSFYDTPYSQIYVGANGLVGFVNDGLSEYVNWDIPNPAVPNAAIYPYWDDLNPAAGGTVRIGIEGTYPLRHFVISWVGVPPYSSSNALTFQVILCETTNDVVFQYLEVQPGDTLYGAGRQATIGLENATGGIARKYSYMGSTLLTNGQAIQFTTNRNVTIAEAGKLGSGVACSIEDAAVSAVTSPSVFYIEDDLRSSGISVYRSAHGVSVGQRVAVVGTASTNTSGEKFINAGTVTPTEEQATTRPVLMPNMFVGGADCFYNPDTKAGQQGVKDAAGLNNIGLLISTAGRVTFSNGTYFYIDDGSVVQDNSGHAGIRVLGSVPVSEGEDPVGKYVLVTGASSCFKGTGSDTNLYRLIRATNVQRED